MEIKNIYGVVIFSDESENIKDCLENAVKKDANLYNANLEDANLRNANLRNANLINANLINANLRNAIKIPIYCKWPHGVTNGLIHIGCKKRSVEEWKEFLESSKENETKRGTKEFKQIEAVIRAYIAYLEVLNN